MRSWLIKIRGKKTQQMIADQCGISQNFYSWIEKGERTPSVDVAKRIAAALGFEWTRYFDDEQDTGKKGERQKACREAEGGRLRRHYSGGGDNAKCKKF